MDGCQVIHGDCLEHFESIGPVDSIVTDPPYGLSFMGKAWDHGVPGAEFWSGALSCAKPGSHLLAFGGTRTFHRLTCAIEDAGWEIRDCLMWVYGSGFPKSHSVGKAIDKAGGESPELQSRMLLRKRTQAGMSREQLAVAVGCTPSSIRDWEEGRARSSGRAVEFITPSEEYRSKLANILGYSEDERRVSGVSQDRRSDGSVYGVGHTGVLRTGGHTEASREWQGWGTCLKPAWEPVILARKPLSGTIANNVLTHGTGALNIDACRVEPTGESQERQNEESMNKRYTDRGATNFSATPGVRGGSPSGRWPANLIHDGSDDIVDMFPESKDGVAVQRNRDGAVHNEIYGKFKKPPAADVGFGGSGSSARFFYCAKASKSDRGPGNNHPTVKPIALMRYLCRLITPPGGLILDPFAGSGSTGVAAANEGFRFIGIESVESYVDICKSRLGL